MRDSEQLVPLLAHVLQITSRRGTALLGAFGSIAGCARTKLATA